MSESDIENEPGYQDDIGPDSSIFLAWWAWGAVIVTVILAFACGAS